MIIGNGQAAGARAQQVPLFHQLNQGTLEDLSVHGKIGFIMIRHREGKSFLDRRTINHDKICLMRFKNLFAHINI
jgi:hypothetical protein